jgi:hypothetical protein
MTSLPPLDHDEIIRRISLDVADGYDEELEMEIEDRHPLPGVSPGPEGAAEKDCYQETPKTPIVLPQREHHEHYSRQAVPANMLVPEVY